MNAVETLSIEAGFGPNLRAWRQFRRLSQLELSLRADISQRHLSWLETGRSQPSRHMVVRLGEALDIPLRERNLLLNAAGFVALYRERGLDEEEMTAVREALSKMLDQQMPYPGIVVDRAWNILMTNGCADALLSAVLGGNAELAEATPNIALLTLHPQALRPLIANWDEVAHMFVQRLRRDLEQTVDSELRAHYESLIALASDGLGNLPEPSTALMPMLTLDLQLGRELLRLFSIISTFGTAQDVTADELRIETFFPVDAASDGLLRALAGP